MTLEFKIDANRITVGDMLALEDAQAGLRPFHGVSDVLSRHLVGANGEYLPAEAARAALTKLTLGQFNEALGQFIEKVQELQAAAVPPAKSGN